MKACLGSIPVNGEAHPWRIVGTVNRHGAHNQNINTKVFRQLLKIRRGIQRNLLIDQVLFDHAHRHDLKSAYLLQFRLIDLCDSKTVYRGFIALIKEGQNRDLLELWKWVVDNGTMPHRWPLLTTQRQ